MQKLLEEEELLFIQDFLRTEEAQKHIALAWNLRILVQKIFNYGVLRAHLYDVCEGYALNSEASCTDEFFSCG